ncbi:MAG: helix-turn-helix domain-containing protein [Nitrospira sp.]|nr:helix-turn-helix domain-containing protein [Nitrospira sp.]MDR4463459.1 helix-turn-helix domain-containing protein [Nitrospira sp.]
MEPILLRIQETAKLLRVSKWTIYRWVDEGRLRGTKIGRGSLRVFRASVEELIEKTRIEDPVGPCDMEPRTDRVKSLSPKKPRKR